MCIATTVYKAKNFVLSSPKMGEDGNIKKVNTRIHSLRVNTSNISLERFAVELQWNYSEMTMI